LAPIWEEVATELKGEVNVAKVDANAEVNKALSHRFNIGSLPAMFLFKDGNLYMTRGPPRKEYLLRFAREGYEKNPPHLNGPVPAVVLPEDVPSLPVHPEEHSGPSDVVTLTDENFEHLVRACRACLLVVGYLQPGKK
jgi:hypothetical protein